MNPELPIRVLAAARRHAPTTAQRGKLVPFRDAVLTHLAKGSSYETIAAFFKGFGIQIEASAVGNYCRRHCPEADVDRTRRELVAAATGDTAPPPPAPAGDKRRSSRIARDDL